VGKSRLLNALAGYDRAIVHERPGTTRDVVTVPLALDGWPVEVADTAGLREPADAVEAAGVARAGRAHDEADLVVLLLDRSEPLRDEDRALLDRYPKALRVASKADLAPSWDDADLIGAVAVSAETGRGLDDLIARVVSRLVGTPPGPGAAVPFRDGHVRRLDSLRASLEAGQLDAFRARIVAWTRPLGAGDGTGLSLPV
jgi:tRNA modification GTPase